MGLCLVSCVIDQATLHFSSPPGAETSWSPAGCRVTVRQLGTAPPCHQQRCISPHPQKMSNYAGKTSRPQWIIWHLAAGPPQTGSGTAGRAHGFGTGCHFIQLQALQRSKHLRCVRSLSTLHVNKAISIKNEYKNAASEAVFLKRFQSWLKRTPFDSASNN